MNYKKYLRRKPKYILIDGIGKDPTVFKGLKCQYFCLRTKHGIFKLAEIFDPVCAKITCVEANKKSGYIYPRYTRKKKSL